LFFIWEWFLVIYLYLSSNQVYFSGTSMVKIHYLANH